MNLKDEIKALAKEIGISKIGFTTADDFNYLEKSLRLAREEDRSSGFEHKVIEERLDPKLSLASAKTIISIALAYPHKLPTPAEKSQFKRGGEFPSFELGFFGWGW